MIRFVLSAFAFVLVPFAAVAQQTASAPPESNPVSNSLRRIVDLRSKNIIAAAEEMPADKYGYSPTPQQMTFAHLIIHITGTNLRLCPSISGTAAPPEEKLAETDGKDKLMKSLKASFDYCTQALAKVDDSNLGEQVPGFGPHTISRAMAMFVLASSFADHYGTEAMYLRANNLVPPSAQQGTPPPEKH